MKTRLIILILGTMLKALSPILRRTLDDIIRNLYVRAQTTETEVDDIFVTALAEFLDVDLSGVEINSVP